MALYYMAKGPVDYTVVGSPTIKEGVASGFAGGSSGQGNYLKTQSLPNFTGDVEIVIKFKADAWAYGVLSSWIISGYSCFISINGNGKPACYFSRTGVDATNLSIDESAHSFAFTAGQDCYLKVSKTEEGTLTMYSSNDGQTYTQFATKTNTNYGTSTVSSYFRIGVNASYNPGSPFNGSIDLNETYIKVNGQLWFGNCPMEVQKHQLRGPVGYEVVGSPTIVDGIASGFSVSDYLQTSNALSSSSNNIFIKIRFKTPSTVANGSTNICFFGSILTNNNCIRLYKATSYGIYLAVFGWDLFAGRNLIEENAWHTVDFSSIDGISTCTLYDKNGAVLNSSSSSTLQVNIDNVGYFGGKYSQSIDSIDLNQTYIKVNGKLWFYQPQETKYIVKDGKLVWADPRIYIDDNGAKTYASQNIAPVPAGYTFGNTTTHSIGYVDMRTQQFTAAPQGATIGRDE